jgi:hypothetical protein
MCWHHKDANWIARASLKAFRWSSDQKALPPIFGLGFDHIKYMHWDSNW